MSEIRYVTFQAKADLRFVRIEGGDFHGSVQINKVHRGAPGAPESIQLLAEFQPNEWASIVATMSALGETGTTFRMLEAMQK
jgi:hypothetical protein